jgi:transcription elongation factor GreB
MARWRQPPPKSSPYITPEGEKALKAELRELWQLRRMEVVPALSAAAAEGDRSENAEYIYRKKQLAEIDRRVRYISKRLDEVQVVHHAPHAQDKVFFGATVTLVDDEERKVSYRIVGADETSAANGFISVDSPLARALLGKSIESEVSVQLPERLANYRILNISYS